MNGFRARRAIRRSHLLHQAIPRRSGFRRRGCWWRSRQGANTAAQAQSTKSVGFVDVHIDFKVELSKIDVHIDLDLASLRVERQDRRTMDLTRMRRLDAPWFHAWFALKTSSTWNWKMDPFPSFPSQTGRGSTSMSSESECALKISPTIPRPTRGLSAPVEPSTSARAASSTGFRFLGPRFHRVVQTPNGVALHDLHGGEVRTPRTSPGPPSCRPRRRALGG